MDSSSQASETKDTHSGFLAANFLDPTAFGMDVPAEFPNFGDITKKMTLAAPFCVLVDSYQVPTASSCYRVIYIPNNNKQALQPTDLLHQRTLCTHTDTITGGKTSRLRDSTSPCSI